MMPGGAPDPDADENPTPYPFVKEYETMFCDKCPHQAEINAALAPCQTCECAAGGKHGYQHAHDEWCTKQCPNFKVLQKAMRPCRVCEAGKLHGEISTDASDAAKTALQYALPNDHCPTAGVTNLNPDVEDALRKAMCVLFDFTPMQLLLIQHVCHGRNLSTFREILADLKHKLNTRYDLSEEGTSFKAIAFEWKKAIVARFPPIAPFFTAMMDANAGGCRR